jgi:hypothetical protein
MNKDLTIYDMSDLDNIADYLGLEIKSDIKYIKGDLKKVIELAKKHKCDYIFTDDYHTHISDYFKTKIIYQDNLFTIYKQGKLKEEK